MLFRLWHDNIVNESGKIISGFSYDEATSLRRLRTSEAVLLRKLSLLRRHIECLHIGNGRSSSVHLRCFCISKDVLPWL